MVDADQVKAKLRFDPKGLLNPGKLEGWEAVSYTHLTLPTNREV